VTGVQTCALPIYAI